MHYHIVLSNSCIYIQVNVNVTSWFEVLDNKNCTPGYCYRVLYGNFDWVNVTVTSGSVDCCLSSCNGQSCDFIGFGA